MKVACGRGGGGGDVNSRRSLGRSLSSSGRAGRLGETIENEKRLGQELLAMGVLALERVEDVATQTVLEQTKVQRGSTRQAHDLHVIAALGLREREQMRDVQRTGDSDEVAQRVLLGGRELAGRERLHALAHVQHEFAYVSVHVAAMDHHRVRRVLHLLTLVVCAKLLTSASHGSTLQTSSNINISIPPTFPTYNIHKIAGPNYPNTLIKYSNGFFHIETAYFSP